MGISEVAAIGIASVIQKVAIIKATAAVRFASIDIPDGNGNKRTAKKRINPKNNPISLLILQNLPC